MRKIRVSVAGVMMGIPCLVLTMNASAAEVKSPPSDTQLIESAMSAAPAKVGKNAAIVVMQADGDMRTLRHGSNGFTCMPDNPSTPGPYPMCMDKNSVNWVHAWVARKAPQIGKVGLMYMLSGGTDASNTDPFAARPEAGNHWVETGPHVMIVGADDAFYDSYPKSAVPDTSAPYIMWADTPYRHLMVPVK